MRNPPRNLRRWLGLLGVAVLCVSLGEWLDGTPSSVLMGSGALLLLFSLFAAIRAALATVGYVRLRRGRGVVARWRVSSTEWEAFRHFDAHRAAQNPKFTNDFDFRPETADAGVEVIVGARQLIVDDSYHVMRTGGNPALRGVQWLGEPGLEVLEFKISYYRGSTGSVVMALRVPVAATARDAARRAYDHYHALIATVPTEGIAFRKRRLVVGGGLVVMALSLAVAGVGWAMQGAGHDPGTSGIVIGIGVMGLLAASLFTGIIALVTRGSASRS